MCAIPEYATVRTAMSAMGLTAMRATRIAIMLFVGHAVYAPAALAQSAPVQIYGRLQLGLERFHTSAASDGKPAGMTRESNYRSVIGFRGREDLGAGLHAVFQLESALGPDTGAGAIASRDTRVGLEGRFGTVFLGHWSTPYTSATSGLDPFYPTTAGYAGIIGNGSTSSAGNISDTSAFDRRQQNSIAFWSASAHGMSLRLAHGLNEETPATGARPSLTSAAIIYDAGPWYLTLAHEGHHEYQGRGSNDLGTKFGAAYRFSPTRLGALRISAIVERLRYETISGRLARRAYFLSVTDQIGPHSLRLTVAKAAEASGQLGQQVGRVRAGADSGALHLTPGYDYALSNRSSVFAYLTRLRNGENGVVDFGTNALGISTGARLEGAAVGLRHWF